MARYAFGTCLGEFPNEYRLNSHMSVFLSVHTFVHLSVYSCVQRHVHMCVQTDVHPPVQYICFPVQMEMNSAEAVVLMSTMCHGNCVAGCKNGFVTGSENQFCNRFVIADVKFMVETRLAGKKLGSTTSRL